MNTDTTPAATVMLMTDAFGCTTTVVTSTGPWYQYLRSLIRLYLERRVDDEWMQTRLTEYTQAIHDSGDPAARQILGWAFLPFDEPDTLDPHARMAELAAGSGIWPV